MSYQPQRELALRSNSIDQPIRGGGYFPVGEYDVNISATYSEEEECIILTMADITGDSHIEKVWVDSFWFDVGLRAALLPDIRIQKYIDNLMEACDYNGLADLYTGLAATVTIGYSAGYTIKRDGPNYVAVCAETNGQFTDWGTLPSVLEEVRRRGLKKSMHRMRDIVGRHHANIKMVYQKFGVKK